MHSPKNLLPFAALIALAALATGALLWRRQLHQPLPSQVIADTPAPTIEEREREELRQEEPPPPPPPTGPIELSPDVAVTHEDQLRSCRKVIALVDKCVAQGIPLDGNPWSKIHGYSMPLPHLPAQPPGYTLEPNPAVCAVASEWKTYCTANVYPRE